MRAIETREARRSRLLSERGGALGPARQTSVITSTRSTFHCRGSSCFGPNFTPANHGTSHPLVLATQARATLGGPNLPPTPPRRPQPTPRLALSPTQLGDSCADRPAHHAVQHSPTVLEHGQVDVDRRAHPRTVPVPSRRTAQRTRNRSRVSAPALLSHLHS